MVYNIERVQFIITQMKKLKKIRGHKFHFSLNKKNSEKNSDLPKINIANYRKHFRNEI